MYNSDAFLQRRLLNGISQISGFVCDSSTEMSRNMANPAVCHSQDYCICGCKYELTVGLAVAKAAHIQSRNAVASNHSVYLKTLTPAELAEARRFE